MEISLRNIAAWCWRYTENTRNYPGLHFTAQAIACDAITTCLGQLRQEGPSAYRTISLRNLDSEDEAKISGGLKYESFSRLRVTLHDDLNLPQAMSFRADGSMVWLDFSELGLLLFESGLRDVKSGIGDYSIAPRETRRKKERIEVSNVASECLWFWPCFGHLQVRQ